MNKLAEQAFYLIHSHYGGISLFNKYKSQKAYQLPSQKGFFSFCCLVLILHQQPSTPRGLLPGADTNLCSSFFKRVISLHSWMSSILHRRDGTGDTHNHLLAPHMLHVSQTATSQTLYRPRKWNTNRESWNLLFFLGVEIAVTSQRSASVYTTNFFFQSLSNQWCTRPSMLFSPDTWVRSRLLTQQLYFT